MMVDVWGLHAQMIHQTDIQLSRQDMLSAWFEDILPFPGHVQYIPS